MGTGRIPAYLRAATLFLLALLAAPPAARAQDAAYTVTGVEVDKTADSAAAAREAAVAEGQRIAFRKLMERLTPAADQARWARLTDRDVAPLVESFQVEQERSSSVRYLATMTYRFRPAAVRGFLRGAGVTPVESGGRPVLVVPIYRATGGETLLWEDANPWRQLWGQRSGRPGLVQVVTPLGDAQDIAALDVAKAAAGPANRFEPLLQRYGAGSAVVAEVTNDAASVTVTARRDGEVLVQQQFPVGAEERTVVLGRAADRVIAALEERWKRDSAAVAVPAGSILVRVPITGLEDWNQIRRRLATVPAIRSMEVKGVSRGEGVLQLGLGGDPAQLGAALAQRDFILEDQGGVWVLRSRSQ